MTKVDTQILTKMSLKNQTTLFEARHTPTAHRREYGPLSLGSQREVSQKNTFRSVLMCNNLELIYSSFFSTIGSVLYLASTKIPRLWQLSESARRKEAH